MTRAVDWGLTDEAHDYVMGGAVLQQGEEFADGVYWLWATAESPGALSLGEAEPWGQQCLAAPDPALLAQLVELLRPLGLPELDEGHLARTVSGELGDEAVLSTAQHLVDWMATAKQDLWAGFEHRLQAYREANAGGAAAPVDSADPATAYQWVVEQLTAEDPEFRAQLEADPELAQQIYAEATSLFDPATLAATGTE